MPTYRFFLKACLMILLSMTVGCGGDDPVTPPDTDATPPAVITTIFVGGNPRFAAVDPSTNRVYVTSAPNGVQLTVINAATNAPIDTIPMGGNAGRLAVNPNTSRVYVPIFTAGKVLVIDGSANPPSALTTITVGDIPEALGVNPVTNRIYVAKRGGLTSTVSVIDGVTNAVIVTGIPVGSFPSAVGVNSTTNRVYVTDAGDDAVTVIDGATNSVIATVALPATSSPRDVAVNAATNRVYVTERLLSNLSVIDGATNAVIATVPVGIFPFAVAVNPNRNLIYLTDADDKFFVVDGVTNGIIHTLALGPPSRILDDLAVNPTTGRIYAPDANGSATGRVVLVIGEVDPSP